jgi:hypothetical protein
MNPKDIVFTPNWLAKEICEMFPIKGKILEPCSGDGAFLKYLPQNTEWCEISRGINFYDYNQKVDWIVTNPPYSDYNKFLEHSLFLANNIVFLVPVAKMFKSIKILSAIFNYGGFVSIHVLPARRAGFPFGFPCGVYYLKRNYRGQTKIELFPLKLNEETLL